MVHLEDAEAALAAVVGSLWLPSLLTCALFAVLHVHVLALERCSHPLLDLSGVCERCPQVVQDCEATESVEDQAQEDAFS